jgi:hypothetical protein
VPIIVMASRLEWGGGGYEPVRSRDYNPKGRGSRRSDDYSLQRLDSDWYSVVQPHLHRIRFDFFLPPFVSFICCTCTVLFATTTKKLIRYRYPVQYGTGTRTIGTGNCRRNTAISPDIDFKIYRYSRF